MRSLIAATILLAASVAHAQEPERFRLERTDGGFARIDTATGEVTTCIERGDQLVCRLAADERAALMARMDELEARIERLEDRSATGLPSDAEVDRALGLMERFMRGFVGIVRDLDETSQRS